MSTTVEYDKKIIYLDHAATTPLDEEVLEEMLPFFSGYYGNASALHAGGRRAARALARAREELSAAISAEPAELIFTGSGTESDNLAVLGAARAHQEHGRHVIISAIEHKAVLQAAHALTHEGFSVSVVPSDTTGRVDPASVCALIRDDTVLVSVMLGNNEIGTVQPVAEIADLLRAQRRSTGLPLLHTDACQASGYLSLNVQELGVDLLSFNGSKVYGPKGVGALYKKRDVRLSPLTVGGDQEGGLRAGTESLALIIGLTAAFRKAEALRVKESARLTTLRTKFISHLKTEVPRCLVNGSKEHTLPHIIHLTIPYVEGESMVLLLDREGVAAATGSACSALDLKPSHVLTALGHNEELLHGSLRFSLGRETTWKDLEYTLSVFPPIVERLTQTSALTTRHYEKIR